MRSYLSKLALAICLGVGLANVSSGLGGQFQGTEIDVSKSDGIIFYASGSGLALNDLIDENADLPERDGKSFRPMSMQMPGMHYKDVWMSTDNCKNWTVRFKKRPYLRFANRIKRQIIFFNHLDEVLTLKAGEGDEQSFYKIPAFSFSILNHPKMPLTLDSENATEEKKHLFELKRKDQIPMVVICERDGVETKPAKGFLSMGLY